MLKASRIKPLKIVVFDLDETLGCFAEVGMFWEALQHFYMTTSVVPSNAMFFEMLNLFPDFLRPHILTILTYLLECRQKKQCYQLMIYTNNQGPPSWVKLISDYFSDKLGEKVFDQIISAFKVHGKVVEVGRTMQEKCVDDLVNCTQIPPDTEICFLDDQYHPLMQHDNVYYITVKPYYYTLPFADMASMYYHEMTTRQKPLLLGSRDAFIKYIETYTSKFKFQVVTKAINEQEVDKIVSKKILSYLEDFLQEKPTASTSLKKKKTMRSMKEKMKKK